MKAYFLPLFIITLLFSGAYAQQRNIRSAERALEQGKLLRAQKKIDKATDHRKTQNDPKAWLLKSKIYSTIALDSNAFPSVKEPTQTAIQALAETQKLTSPDDLIALYARQYQEHFYHQMMDQAISAADSGQYQDVWKSIAKAKIILPQQPEAYLFGGRLAFALQDFERAKKNYYYLVEELQFQGYGLYEVLNNLITIHLLRHTTLDSSLFYLHKAQQLLPDSLNFYEREISLLINAGKIAQAVDRLKDENFPKSLKPFLFTEVAQVYQQKNQPLKAIEQYKNALQHSPDHQHILLKLADSHRQIAEEKALQTHEQAITEAAQHYQSALQYLKKTAAYATLPHADTKEAIQAIELKLKELTAAHH